MQFQKRNILVILPLLFISLGLFGQMPQIHQFEAGSGFFPKKGMEDFYVKKKISKEVREAKAKKDGEWEEAPVYSRTASIDEQGRFTVEKSGDFTTNHSYKEEGKKHLAIIRNEKGELTDSLVNIYDDKGRLIESWRVNLDQKMSVAEIYSYLPAGAEIPNLAEDQKFKKVSWSHKVYFENKDGKIVEYRMIASGEDVPAMISKYTYDNDGVVTKGEFFQEEQKVPYAGEDYAYDPQGRITAITRWSMPPVENGEGKRITNKRVITYGDKAVTEKGQSLGAEGEVFQSHTRVYNADGMLISEEISWDGELSYKELVEFDKQGLPLKSTVSDKTVDMEREVNFTYETRE